MSLLGRLVALVPRRAFAALGAALGAVLFALRVRRRVVLSNLRLAFPERTEAERLAIARATYRNLGQMAFEFLRVPFVPREELEGMFVYRGWEKYEEARARGKGVVACTGHFGNFEVLAAAHTMRGVPITMITKKGAGGLWRGARKRAGVEDLVVGGGETLKAAGKALQDGRVLGYVIDQNDPSRRAIFPTFFGVPCATAPTPAYIAQRNGAAIVFCLSYPLPDGRHQVVIEGPLDVPDTGDRHRDVLAFMQDLNDRLERYVREQPERWYWLHRRWKRRAPGRNRGAGPGGGERAGEAGAAARSRN